MLIQLVNFIFMFMFSRHKTFGTKKKKYWFVFKGNHMFTCSIFWLLVSRVIMCVLSVIKDVNIVHRGVR